MESSSPRSTSCRCKHANLKPPVSHFTASDGVVYHLERVIGKGGYGVVYACVTDKGIKCALKTAKACTLVMEADVLRAVNKRNCRHFCRLLGEGFSSELKENYIVMEMLGPNFSEIRNMLPYRKFSLQTSLRVSMQMLNSIEHLHACGFMSRDVKPSNFVVGTQYPQYRIIHMIDFGVAKKLVDSTGKPLEQRSRCAWRGTGRYCALANHTKQDQCPRDDIESWFYVTSELMRGKLPWSNILRKDRNDIYKAKKAIRNEKSGEFFKMLPSFMPGILTMVDGWQFTTKPDYKKLYDMLDAEMKAHDFDYAAEYDWEECPVFVAMGKDSAPKDNSAVLSQSSSSTSE
ncbi:hypothetical protein QR680_008330 [Steinernema hermaphroditum]|uniref:Protein kinase domain-containing protein n=1 Tax=Steinernema hermaphroditum TaxID=289476 RepID=A0AA39M7N8_9BILA|nr:hypothetical protein QR680_008330 [Steinernema hermaphroditum]